MINNIFEKASLQLNIPLAVIKNTYLSYWLFIKNTIESLPITDNMIEEDFNKLRVSFNIPKLGKLYTSFDKYKRIKNKYLYVKNKIHKTNV